MDDFTLREICWMAEAMADLEYLSAAGGACYALKAAFSKSRVDPKDFHPFNAEE